MWSSWGCSVRGPRHKRASLPNQDAWKARAYSWGNVVVVSDGLGSKSLSDIGSKAACNAVIDAARHFAAHSIAPIETIPPLIHALWRIRLGLHDVNECCATCLFVIQILDRIILGKIGDGLIAALGDAAASGNADKVLMTADKEDSDSYINNATDCLSEKFYLKQWELKELSAASYTRIMLCTDGVSDDLTPAGCEIFSGEICNNGNNVPELRHTLVKWPVQGHSDDKTIACLVNSAPKEFTHG